MAPKTPQKSFDPRPNPGAAVGLSADKRSRLGPRAEPGGAVLPRTGATELVRLSPKDAAVAAARYFREVTGYNRGVSIEEIERTTEGRWRVTLGYQEEPESSLFVGGVKKAYKVIEIDGKTGEGLSMKMREA